MPPTGTLADEGSNGVSPSLALAHDLKLHEGCPSRRPMEARARPQSIAMADDVEQRFTIQIALQLGFDQVPGALVDPGHPPADMRSDQDALHAPKPVTVRQRLGIGHVQRGPDPTRT